MFSSNHTDVFISYRFHSVVVVLLLARLLRQAVYIMREHVLIIEEALHCQLFEPFVSRLLHSVQTTHDLLLQLETTTETYDVTKYCHFLN